MAVYFIPNFENVSIMGIAIALFFFYGVIIGNEFEKRYGKDPRQCTIDEVVGMWITLLFLPKSFIISGIAFLVWRAFDIFKPFPANRMEDLKGGLGIMLDDVVSALYSMVIMNLLVIGLEYLKIKIPF